MTKYNRPKRRFFMSSAVSPELNMMSANEMLDYIGAAVAVRSSGYYILYAKEKGCSMTGPEDEWIERLNVLKEE